LAAGKSFYMNGAKEKEMVLTIDGKPVALTGFVREIIEAALRGMVSSLKGVDPDGEINITIRRKKKQQ